jgi:hypothetical protein
MKLKPPSDWFKRTHSERLASVLFPSHSDDATRKEMATIAAGKGKRGPSGPSLTPDHLRGSCSPLGGQGVRSK